ncbi:MAG: hypothetical protein GXP08_08490 [Gammaproteobacteria bacterium]|nr:hypothetical protein [Gammaproteobacteria bacterium]
MITGEIKNKVDQLWNTFWSGGVSNPLSVIEQITYLLFAKRLDDIQTAKEAQANLLGEKIEDSLFMKKQNHLRWSRFKDYEPERKFNVFKDVNNRFQSTIVSNIRNNCALEPILLEHLPDSSHSPPILQVLKTFCNAIE